MRHTLRRFAPSPSLAVREGDDGLAAGRPLLAVPALVRALSGSIGTLFAGAFLCLSLSGCAVVAVTSAAVSVTAGAVGLAADAAIGTAKIVGKGVGKAADALMDDEKPGISDSSGVNIRYRDSANSSSMPAETPAPAATATPVAPPSAIQSEY